MKPLCNIMLYLRSSSFSAACLLCAPIPGLRRCVTPVVISQTPIYVACVVNWLRSSKLLKARNGIGFC
jgi:hypothetical protein